MKLIIGNHEYRTRREYLPKTTSVVLPPPDAHGHQLAGAAWIIADDGIELWLSDRPDLLAIPEVKAYLDKRTEETALLDAPKKNRRTAVALLVSARETFCGIGTRQAKLKLNKLAKTSIYAKALRVALEIEDKNLT